MLIDAPRWAEVESELASCGGGSHNPRAPAPSPGARGAGHLKILLIDDESDIRRIARLSLTRVGGMEALDADNGRDGIRKAEEEQPDAILLDVMLPGMDGPAILAALRANAATAHIPVIFLTGKGAPAEIARLKALGATGVLPKPFDPGTLPDQVRRLLAGEEP